MRATASAGGTLQAGGAELPGGVNRAEAMLCRGRPVTVIRAYPPAKWFERAENQWLELDQL